MIPVFNKADVNDESLGRPLHVVADFLIEFFEGHLATTHVNHLEHFSLSTAQGTPCPLIPEVAGQVSMATSGCGSYHSDTDRDRPAWTRKLGKRQAILFSFFPFY